MNAPETRGGASEDSRRWSLAVPAASMPDADLAAEPADREVEWDAMRAALEEEECGGGSPGEWLHERMGELEHELARRGQPMPTPVHPAMRLGDDLMDRLFGDRPAGHPMVIHAEPFGVRDTVIEAAAGNGMALMAAQARSLGFGSRPLRVSGEKTQAKPPKHANKNRDAQKAQRAARKKSRG